MTFPENVLKIIDQAAHNYPADIGAAVGYALKRLGKLTVFKSLVDQLVAEAIRERIYDIRHRENIDIKGRGGQYGTAAKVTAGLSESVQKLGEQMYFMKIGGLMLGDIVGKDLAALADSELAVGNGHLVNARLLSRLSAVVPAGKRVRDAVSGAKLRGILRMVQKEVYGEEAA